MTETRHGRLNFDSAGAHREVNGPHLRLGAALSAPPPPPSATGHRQVRSSDGGSGGGVNADRGRVGAGDGQLLGVGFPMVVEGPGQRAGGRDVPQVDGGLCGGRDRRGAGGRGGGGLFTWGGCEGKREFLIANYHGL